MQDVAELHSRASSLATASSPRTELIRALLQVLRPLRSLERFPPRKNSATSQAANPNLLRDTPFHHTNARFTVISEGKAESFSPAKTTGKVEWETCRLKRSLTASRKRGKYITPTACQEVKISETAQPLHTTQSIQGKMRIGAQTAVSQSLLKGSLVKSSGRVVKLRPRSANPTRIPQPPVTQLLDQSLPRAKSPHDSEGSERLPISLQRYISELERLLQSERKVSFTQRRVKAETQLENRHTVTSS